MFSTSLLPCLGATELDTRWSKRFWPGQDVGRGRQECEWNGNPFHPDIYKRKWSGFPPLFLLIFIGPKTKNIINLQIDYKNNMIFMLINLNFICIILFVFYILNELFSDICLYIFYKILIKLTSLYWYVDGILIVTGIVGFRIKDYGIVIDDKIIKGLYRPFSGLGFQLINYLI